MIKNKFFDDLEARSKDERISDHLKKLNKSFLKYIEIEGLIISSWNFSKFQIYLRNSYRH